MLGNRMKVLLISDPSSDTGAASLQVQVGNLLDPANRTGTANYLQNMILKGSKKYPYPAQIDEFFRKNNGECTAFSSWTSTNYHFKVDNIVFEEALDIFANFFISPTFPDYESPRVIKSIHH